MQCLQLISTKVSNDAESLMPGFARYLLQRIWRNWVD